MRTTVDLPPALHRRARELAEQRGASLSVTVADLAARGLAALGEPVRVGHDDRTGFPMIAVGRPVTSIEVADLIDEG